MAASTTAFHPDPAASSPPPWILLDANAHIGECPDDTASAMDLTSNDKLIEVSIRSVEPPAPSRLFVHCPDLESDVFREDPRILCTAEGFLLLRVHIGSRTGIKSLEKGDYFVFQAAQDEPPSLRRLPQPLPFSDDSVGLLPRGKHFMVAALSSSADGYHLYVFNSELWAWNFFTKVPVVSPHIPFPIDIRKNAIRLCRHTTSTVITIGGDGGTMGWVDLWSGILLCDLLCSSHTLRSVPLPMPGRYVRRQEKILGCPKAFRGIAVVQGCLMMVEMESCVKRLPEWDRETEFPKFRVDEWELTTYTNRKITNSREDWKFDCTVKASGIRIDDAMRWELLQSGLLHERTSAAIQRNLENLHTCQPILSLDDKGVVYLLTRPKFNQRKAWVIAVDMENNKLQALAEFGTDRSLGLSFAYCPSRISSYMGTPPGN
uniref:DUF1618 domain-containing protein n=1 Tax=Arundo donax TaxID=35708 RepID=A0A0A9CMC1_ARUDO